MTIPVKIYMALRFLQNKRIGRVGLIIFFLLFVQKFNCYSQNLFNPENSQKYAEYLFSTHQHKLAAEEFERLVYFDEKNIDFKYYLIKSYGLSGNIKSGIKRIYSFYPESFSSMPSKLATEFLRLQILSDSSTLVENFIVGSNTLSSENKAIYSTCNLLLIGKYHEANVLGNSAFMENPAFPKNLLLLTENAEKTKFKSPLLAAGFSAIIPGTGKFYTGNWADGVFSMLFVAGNAWQAYRGFSEKGVKSVYGWVFAGLSTSFYIGNIYGSSKAATRYNNRKKNDIKNQLFEFVRSDSF